MKLYRGGDGKTSICVLFCYDRNRRKTETGQVVLAIYRSVVGGDGKLPFAFYFATTDTGERQRQV